MYSLGFDFRNGNWSVYLHGRDKPIGDIVPFPEGGWFGQMSLDGYNVSERGANPQIIVDAFEAWVAAGMPSNSSLLDEKSPCTTLRCEPTKPDIKRGRLERVHISPHPRDKPSFGAFSQASCV